jgi:hypothetical protein
MNYEINELFREDLIMGERIIWTGQPEKRIIFSGEDILLVPFSLLWGGFAIWWEFAVLRAYDGSISSLSFILFGIPFVIMGLYFIFGRFIYKKYQKRHTYYAITDKRAIILTKKRFGKFIKTEYLNKIPSINKSIRSNGIGTITFGNSSFIGSMYGNSRMDFFSRYSGQNVIIFCDIKDAEQVDKMVNDLKNK